MINRKNGTIIALSAVILVMMTAGASALITRNNLQADKPVEVVTTSKTVNTGHAHRENINWNRSQPQQAAPVKTSQCSDGNVVGAVLGAAAGGLVGNQLGKGSGNTVATIGGAAVGGLAGQQYIPTRNTLCR